MWRKLASLISNDVPPFVFFEGPPTANGRPESVTTERATVNLYIVIA